MSNQQESTRKSSDFLLLLLMSALVAAWGIAGALDVPNRTEAGFVLDRDHVISELTPGGPAERVNMQVGDRVIGVAGQRIEDTANILRLPRVDPGERRAYVVERGDQTIRYRPAFQAISPRAQHIEYLSTIVGLGFLLIPLAACLTRPNAATRILFLMGLGLSLSFFSGPYIQAYDIRSIAAVVAELFFLLGLGAMVHFLLLFPSPRPSLGAGWGRKLVYWPILLIWALIAWRILFTPQADSMPAYVGQFISGVGITVFLVFGLFLLLRNYSRTDRATRKRLGLNLMMWGTAAAIIPAAVARLASMVSAHTPLPGQDYYFVALVLVPATWALSASKSEHL